MFDAGFAMIFRAVERIRTQLMGADEGLKRVLAEELLCLRRLGEQYIDHWMTLEDQISDLMETYQLCEEPQWVHSPLHLQISPVPTVHTDNGAVHSTHLNLQNRTAGQPEFSLEMEEAVDLSSVAWNHSDFVAVGFRKGLAYYDLFMFSDAAKSLEEVVDAADTPVARLYLAASYAAGNRFDETLAQLAIVRKSSEDPLLLCGANEIEAQLHIARGDFPTAIRVLRNITEYIPKYPDAWFNLAISYASQNDYEAAEQAALRALALDANDAEAAVLVVAVCLQLGKVSEAMTICAQALHLHPQHPELLKVSAQIAKRKGDYQKGIEICKGLTNRHPDLPEAWALLCWFYLRTEEHGLAVAALKKQLSLYPEHATALLQLGIVLLLDGDIRRAEQVLLKCLTAYPNKALIWIPLGVISISNGNETQAHTRFLRATKDTRKDVKRLALYLYGKALMRTGRYNEAEKYLKAAAVLGSFNPAIVLALAENAEQLGRTQEAAKLYHRAQQTSGHPQ